MPLELVYGFQYKDGLLYYKIPKRHFNAGLIKIFIPANCHVTVNGFSSLYNRVLVSMMGASMPTLNTRASILEYINKHINKDTVHHSDN